MLALGRMLAVLGQIPKVVDQWRDEVESWSFGGIKEDLGKSIKDSELSWNQTIVCGDALMLTRVTQMHIGHRCERSEKRVEVCCRYFMTCAKSACFVSEAMPLFNSVGIAYAQLGYVSTLGTTDFALGMLVLCPLETVHSCALYLETANSFIQNQTFPFLEASCVSHALFGPAGKAYGVAPRKFSEIRSFHRGVRILVPQTRNNSSQ